MAIATQSPVNEKFAFSSCVASDVFHADKSAKGYEWWYFDALSDDGREGVVIIFLDNFVFSPRYNAPENSKFSIRNLFPNRQNQFAEGKSSGGCVRLLPRRKTFVSRDQRISRISIFRQFRKSRMPHRRQSFQIRIRAVWFGLHDSDQREIEKKPNDRSAFRMAFGRERFSARKKNQFGKNAFLESGCAAFGRFGQNHGFG